MEIKIIFEDSDILVLDKPSGITVNRADTTKGEKTVQDWVEDHSPSDTCLPAGKAFDTFDTSDTFSTFRNRAGIVHRIDKETSGILLAAKNLEAFENLQAQFKERKVKKVYTALVHGRVIPEEGEINVPIGRLPWDRHKFGVLAGGKESITKYKVLSIKYHVSEKKKEPLSLLEVYPLTGRTHQIRVHLKYINHPIFADFLYAGRKVSRNDRKLLSRVFLHASKISFFHPKTGERIEFESKLPEELENFLKSLGIG